MNSLFENIDEGTLKLLKALLTYSQNQELHFNDLLDEFSPYLFESKKTILKNTVHTYLSYDKNIFKKYLDKQIKQGTKLLKEIESNNNSQKNLDIFSNWDDYNLEILKRSFNIPNNEYLQGYQKSEIIYNKGRDYTKLHSSKYLLNLLVYKINFIKQLNHKVDLLTTHTKNTLKKASMNNDIFIVHGHNNELKITILRTLEKLGLNPIVLHEQPSFGKTIIEKFEKFSDVGFAIILLTKDDVGGKDEKRLNPRARQNVLFEHGFFVGKIGREHVLALVEESVEIPSDLSGIVYTTVDPSGFWKFELVKELKSAGYKIDSNLIL